MVYPGNHQRRTEKKTSVDGKKEKKNLGPEKMVGGKEGGLRCGKIKGTERSVTDGPDVVNGCGWCVVGRRLFIRLGKKKEKKEKGKFKFF